MLSPDRIDELRTAAEMITVPLEDYILADIAKKVATAGKFTSSTAYMIWRLKELGVNDIKIKNELIKRLKINNEKYKN